MPGIPITYRCRRTCRARRPLRVLLGLALAPLAAASGCGTAGGPQGTAVTVTGDAGEPPPTGTASAATDGAEVRQ